MSLLQVSGLTFCYEGSFDNIFENVSFSVDTNWKLGFIGRNGKGKTTFLNLLQGNHEYTGSIVTDKKFDYFPYAIGSDETGKSVMELYEKWKSDTQEWRILCELAELKADAEILYRPVKTLSQGQLTKAMLAVLFSGENEFLLIDEPTNHLDKKGREVIRDYLKSKKGFILVSHDRVLLDAVCDHMLVLNRESIEVVSGNFSIWQENKERKDAFAKAENEKHLKQIGRLKASADRAGRWAIKNENTKIGFDPVKEPERNISTRSYIGAKTKKMQSRVKNFEKRIERQIEEKEGLLNDIESVDDLKLMPLIHHKKRLVECRDFSLGYVNDIHRDSSNALTENGSGNISTTGDTSAETAADTVMHNNVKTVIQNLTFSLEQGDILFLNGENGCGKSSLIKAILMSAGYNDNSKENCFVTDGILSTAGGLVISYISQDTHFLMGSLKEYAKNQNLDLSLLLTLLRKLDMSRVQFEKNMEDYSEGQKKKVLIAASLLTQAHLYIWDEPLNYIDVFSRMQIEKLIQNYKPTMLIVEHDEYFREQIATGIVEL